MTGGNVALPDLFTITRIVIREKKIEVPHTRNIVGKMEVIHSR